MSAQAVAVAEVVREKLEAMRRPVVVSGPVIVSSSSSPTSLSIKPTSGHDRVCCVQCGAEAQLLTVLQLKVDESILCLKCRELLEMRVRVQNRVLEHLRVRDNEPPAHVGDLLWSRKFRDKLLFAER